MPAIPFSFFSYARVGVFGMLTGYILLFALIFQLFMARLCPAATILLDPGHGGDDRGAVNGDDYSEKQFTLTLAQQISDLLAPRHRVELSRSSDITVPFADRAAMANHLKADVLISLHAAVVPYCSDRNAAIYFYNDEHLVFPPGLSAQNKRNGPDKERPADWIKIQDRHQLRSQRLASLIRQSLLEGGAFDHVTISRVALVAMMGADLPAVLIEVGCMHPSSTVSAPMDEQEINGFARSIADALNMAVAGLQP